MTNAETILERLAACLDSGSEVILTVIVDGSAKMVAGHTLASVMKTAVDYGYIKDVALVPRLGSNGLDKGETV